MPTLISAKCFLPNHNKLIHIEEEKKKKKKDDKFIKHLLHKIYQVMKQSVQQLLVIPHLKNINWLQYTEVVFLISPITFTKHHTFS